MSSLCSTALDNCDNAKTGTESSFRQLLILELSLKFIEFHPCCCLMLSLTEYNQLQSYLRYNLLISSCSIT